ncbi:MAG TPA: SDR family NAD(P)-dependent oxidoreductase [Rubrobacter sp.]|nr:SDR family NAD(P)-dependent oxidoreductase [Rubrobacter sp.]
MTENGRVALVSGGNRGIGLEVCRQLAGREITVVMGSRDVEQGRAAAAGLSGSVVVRQLDVADPKSVERLSRSIEEEFGRLDILVNNAGISNDDGQRGVDADLDRVKEALEANLFGAWRLCQMAIPLMRRNGYGRIVNVSSVSGHAGTPGQANYAATKGGVVSLTRSLALEWASAGITVNAVAPGIVDTPLFRNFDDGLQEKLKRSVPVQRIGTPEDIAHAVVFFAQREASYITGQTLYVCGGRSLASPSV